MSAENQEPLQAEVALFSSSGSHFIQSPASAVTLATLPIGGRLVLRCRTDWREATVVSITCDSVTLSVGSPTGRTYRVRRPLNASLSFDGLIPILGEGSWRTSFARYDARW